MEQIKDQQRLFQKMFLSPSCQNPPPNLILSIQFLKLVLQELPLLSLQPQRTLLLQILQLFKQQPVNSLLLYHHDQQCIDQPPLLTLIIIAASKCIRTHGEGEDILNLIDWLLAYYPVGLLQVSAITKQFSMQFQQGLFQPVRTRFLHMVLQKYYSVKKKLLALHPCYFFLYGRSQNSILRSIEGMSIKLKNEIAVMFSFQLLEHGSTPSTICKLITNKEELSLKIGKNIILCNQTTKQQINEEEGLKLNVWYKIIVNFGSTETVIFLNGEEISRQKGIIKKEKDRILTQFSFGEGFFGFIAGIAIADKLVAAKDVKDIPQLKKWGGIAKLKQKGLISCFLASCLPFSTFEMRDILHCFDVFQRNHSQVGQNIIIFKDPSQFSGIAHMGGYQILLPLFYLARFYTKQQYPDHLQRILRIWLASLQNFKDTDKKNQKFLLILGHHLEALPHLLTEECVTVLSQIYDKLSLTNKIPFLKYVGWSGLPAKSSGVGVHSWLNWLTKLYQNNKSQCLRSYNLMDVVFWLVKHLQNNQQHCCPQHYLSEARALREFSFDTLTQLEITTKKPHFQAVQNIAAVILQYYIIDQQEQALLQVKSILRLLLHKYSKCLYSTILRILKRQIPKFRQNQFLAQFLLKANILPFLAALAEKIVDPNLLSLVIYLLLLVSPYRIGARAQAVLFLSIVFKRMQQIHSYKFNLLAYGARKMRKRSVDFAKNGQIQQVENIMQKIKLYRQDLSQIQFLLINFSLGAVNQIELTKNNKFISQQGFFLLRCFLPLAPQRIKLNILQIIMHKLLQHPANQQYCIKSIQLNKMIVVALGQMNNNSQGQKLIQAILSKVMSSLLIKQLTLGDYYLLLKTLSRSQLSLTDTLSSIFIQICTHTTLSIDQLLQILLIMINQQQHNQQKSQINIKMMSLLTIKISKAIKQKYLTFSIIDYQTNIIQLLQKVRALGNQMLSQPFFELQVKSIIEEQVNFLFDILLPKIIAGSDITTFLIDFKRQVYIFQLLIFEIIQLIHHQKCIMQIELINSLIEVVVSFVVVDLLRIQTNVNKSFMRMILFIVSHHLSLLENKEPLVLLWHFVIKFMREYAEKQAVESYADLQIKMLENGIQPYLVQIFQIFLRPNNDQYILSFQLLMQLDNFQSVKQYILQTLLIVFLRNDFATIHNTCKSYAQSQLRKQYQQKLIIIQSKLDNQQKKQTQQRLFNQVQKIFQQQSIGEEETRLRYFHQHQCALRKYHSSWNKLWKRMRIYHHPYGLFMAQKNKNSQFLFQSFKFKNFRFKISKYASESGIQPILEAQVQEPWHVCKKLKQQSKNQMSSLVQMMRPSDNYRKKNQSMLSNFTSFFKKIGRQKLQEAPEYEVLWIKRGRKARGRLMINDKQQLVFWYQSLKQEDSHLSFERFSLPFNKLMVKSWRIDTIRQVTRKRYLMNYHALQITLISRKSLLFHFSDHRQQHLLQQLQKIIYDKLQGLGTKLRLNKVPLYSQDWIQQGLAWKVIEDWRTRKISTLQYLITVNRAASRGIYDISQYPVFPWVCQMNDEKQPTLRDLTKTMGGLGSQQRKKIVKQKYAASDPFNPVPPFHFGTHYSSPGVVFNFLIRLAPFTDYCKNLQGGKFDIPDRLFASLVGAWKSAFNQVSDVRQLLPEFYYMPQCLLNTQRLHFGDTQSGERVDNVQLPPWAANNPYFLTTQLRQILQSQHVSSAIGEWIDLIFGCKQRGDAARDNFNLYYYLTYQQYSNCLAEEDDEIYRKSCEAQVVHFGQIPPQIFQKEHPKRITSSIGPIELRVKQKIQLMNSLQEKLIGVHQLGMDLFLIKRNTIQQLTLAKIPAALTKSVQFNFERTLSKAFFNLKKQCAKILFFGRSYFIVYGYITNQFRIFNRFTGALQCHDCVDFRIQYLLVNKQQSLILIGLSTGMLIIFQLQYDSNRLSAKKIHVQVFPHSIVHISEHDGFYAISFGCYVSIYKIERSLYYLSKNPPPPFIRFFRSFHNVIPVKGAFIADSPLYSLLIYDNANIKVYSINGQFIKNLACSPKAVFRLRDKDFNCLFYYVQDSRMVLLSTPDLRCLSQMQISGSLQVFEGAVIYRKQIHMIDCI